MDVPLKAVLEMREDLLRDYKNARLKFLHAKKQLEMINSILKDNRIDNYIHFNGDYDNWIKNFTANKA